MQHISRRRFLELGAGAAAVMAAASACGSGSPTPASTPGVGRDRFGALDRFTVADWGGSTDQAILSAWGKPFTEQNGVPVVSVAMDYGKLRAQVDSNRVTWDLTDAEGWFVHANADLLEPLDYEAIGLTEDDMVNAAFMHPNGVANYVYAWVQAYRTDGPEHPTNWQQFFDTNAFPGTRSLYNYPYGSLEIALLGDGVPFDELYPLDVDRAFRKIESIKGDLVYWNTGAESQQFLVSKTADFVTGWNPRFGYLAMTGLNVDIEWNDSFLAADYHAVPKGARSTEASMEFIKTATQPEAQAEFSQLAGGLGPSVSEATDLLPESLRPWVPTTPDNLSKSVGIQDDAWWGQNFAAVSDEWYKFTSG